MELMFGAASEERYSKELVAALAQSLSRSGSALSGGALDDEPPHIIHEALWTPSSSSRSPAFTEDTKPSLLRLQEAVAAVNAAVRPQSPQSVSLVAGGFAGMAAEAVLFPLDCLKTRVQTRHGFSKSGGFRGIYRGVGTAVAGSAPASAIFFTTYELTKQTLAPYDDASVMQHCSVGVLASVLGELTACSVRVPVDLMKQRLQAGQGANFRDVLRSARCTQTSIFMASFQVSAMRDIMHSSLQFPMYECLKTGAARWGGYGSSEFLPTSHAAMCGSVAGAVSAALTTPMDLLRTRLNLRGPPDAGTSRAPLALLREEVGHIYRTDGLRGFFRGGACRATWMGLGGFVFLGSFELAKNNLSDQKWRAPREAEKKQQKEQEPPPPAPEPELAPAASQQRQLGLEPPPSVSFAAGLVAGIAVDVPLHPLDTIKTRLQAKEGFRAAGGSRGLWSGLSAVLLVSVPGSAIFFLNYETLRHLLERNVPGALQDNTYSIWRDAFAASLADVSACVVRVPCEVLKQRMQAWGPGNTAPTLLHTMRGVSKEGVSGFFAGFGATALREVPFALIQMPLYEELKIRHPWTENAQRQGNTSELALVGVMSGGVAGAVAGMLTTPLDAAKTHIILTENPAERLGLVRTMQQIHATSGVQGLFKGVTPRLLHCGIGGALWLGAFEWFKLLIWRS